MATMTFYPIMDGCTYRDAETGSGTNWADLRDGDGKVAQGGTEISSACQVASGTISNQWLRIARSVFLFDTSSLPSNAVITDATLSLRGESKGDTFSPVISPDVDIYDCAPESNTELAASDYQRFIPKFVENTLHTGSYPHWVYGTSVVAPNGNIIALISTYSDDDENYADIATGRIYRSISTDNGETWSTESILQDKGSDWGAIGGAFVKTSSGKIFFFYNRYKGYREPCDCKIYYKASTDNGDTWGSETYINTGHNYSLLVANGIELLDGTLIMPFSWGTESGDAYWKSSVLISEDNGDTWNVGGTIDFAASTGTGCDEPSVIEKSDYSLYALVRTNQGHIYYSTSADGGETWSPAAATSLVSADINAHLHRVSFSPNRVLVSWNNSATHKYPLVMAYSNDDCATWGSPITVADTSYNSCMPNITVLDGNRAIITWWDNPSPGDDNGKAATFLVSALFQDALSTAIAYNDWVTNGYNDFELNSKGISGIYVNGVSRFGSRNANYDVNNSPPEWTASKLAYLQTYFSEQGVEYKPKLTIEYSFAQDVTVSVPLEELQLETYPPSIVIEEDVIISLGVKELGIEYYPPAIIAEAEFDVNITLEIVQLNLTTITPYIGTPSSDEILIPQIIYQTVTPINYVVCYRHKSYGRLA